MREAALGATDEVPKLVVVHRAEQGSALSKPGAPAYGPRLEQMGEQLRQTSVQIEESVVGVCASIQGISDRARASSARTASFLSRSDAGAGSHRSFDELVHTCGDTMVRLMRMSAEAGELAMQTAERVQQMDRASREINEALLKLEDIAMSNKILALNARIEGARSAEQGAGFSAVAVELAAQTDKSQQVTGQVSDLVSHLRSLAATTYTELQQMQAEGDRKIQQCREEVDTTLQALQGAHGQMKEMLTLLTDEGELLSRDIGAAVRGLQFQDRVSQRIAHVVQDLEALQAHLEDPGHAEFFTEPIFSGHSMREEREIYGIAGAEAAAGDIELF
jgi:methyl-accepting chemotaxis protein